MSRQLARRRDPRATALHQQPFEQQPFEQQPFDDAEQPRPATARRPGGEHAGEHADSDALVREHMPLVGHSVRHVLSRLPRHVSRDDLVSAGMLALVQASRSYDPARGVPFVPFAGQRIRGAILDELREMDWATRSVRRRERELEGVRNQLSVILGCTPTATQLSAATGLSRAQLAGHSSDVARACVTSLHAVPDCTLDSLTCARPIEPDVVLLHRERMAYLRDAVATLPDRLRIVVEGYFFDERPMAELGAELAVTESRVSQLRAEALVLLRHALNAVLESEPDAADATPTGVVQRRRADYVGRLAALRTVADRLAYVADTELGRPA